jgi:hypothetical protein
MNGSIADTVEYGISAAAQGADDVDDERDAAGPQEDGGNSGDKERGVSVVVGRGHPTVPPPQHRLAARIDPAPGCPEDAGKQMLGNASLQAGLILLMADAEREEHAALALDAAVLEAKLREDGDKELADELVRWRRQLLGQ